MQDTEPILSHFAAQAEACRRLGSPFTAAVLAALGERLAAGDPALDPVARFSGDPSSGALALRVAGALHRIAMDGRDRRVARLYARADAALPQHSASLLSSALAANRALLEAYLGQAPQTNEVARSAMLLGGFLTIAEAARLPLAVLEIGASAGLNLLFDRYRYDFGGWSWSADDAVPTIAAAWQGPRPPEVRLVVAQRRGCDRNPLDLGDEETRRRLRSYVWADQKDRLARLDQAIATALEDPPLVERAEAADWLSSRLEEPWSGRASVIVHSIVWQYLEKSEKTRIAGAIARRGAAATLGAPLAWLRLEPEPGADGPALRLTFWPGGEERLLGLGDYHGRRMVWLDAPRS
jgi:hypothetical protein